MASQSYSILIQRTRLGFDEEADNGNRSKVHWDLVLIQRPDYSGGEIHFDGKLIRKDGRFTLPELKPLDATV